MDAYLYRAMSVEDQHAILAQTLISQEQDFYIHSVNLERYALLLLDPALASEDTAFAKRIRQLHTETGMRLQEVRLILVALHRQLPEKALLEAALKRLSKPARRADK